jgi:hypothetical protein
MAPGALRVVAASVLSATALLQRQSCVLATSIYQVALRLVAAVAQHVQRLTVPGAPAVLIPRARHGTAQLLL